MHKWCTIAIAAVLLASCTGNTITSNSQTLPGFWDLGYPVEFDIDNPPQDASYRMMLDIRNTNDYPFSNLFLVTTLKFPNGRTEVDTLEYRMARPDGTWLGTGLGDVKQNKLLFKDRIKFNEAGVYKLSIEHAVRNNGDAGGVKRLDGITDVGYSIEALQ